MSNEDEKDKIHKMTVSQSINKTQRMTDLMQGNMQKMLKPAINYQQMMKNFTPKVNFNVSQTLKAMEPVIKEYSIINQNILNNVVPKMCLSVLPSISQTYYVSELIKSFDLRFVENLKSQFNEIFMNSNFNNINQIVNSSMKKMLLTLNDSLITYNNIKNIFNNDSITKILNNYKECEVIDKLDYYPETVTDEEILDIISDEEIIKEVIELYKEVPNKIGTNNDIDINGKSKKDWKFFIGSVIIPFIIYFLGYIFPLPGEQINNYTQINNYIEVNTNMDNETFNYLIDLLKDPSKNNDKLKELSKKLQHQHDQSNRIDNQTKK